MYSAAPEAVPPAPCREYCFPPYDGFFSFAVVRQLIFYFFLMRKDNQSNQKQNNKAKYNANTSANGGRYRHLIVSGFIREEHRHTICKASRSARCNPSACGVFRSRCSGCEVYHPEYHRKVYAIFGWLSGRALHHSGRSKRCWKVVLVHGYEEEHGVRLLPLRGQSDLPGYAVQLQTPPAG